MATANKPSNSPINSRTTQLLTILILVIIFIALFMTFGNMNSPWELTNSQFISVLENQGVETVEITPMGGDTNYRAYQVTGILVGEDQQEYVTYISNDDEWNYVFDRINSLNHDIYTSNDVVWVFNPAPSYSIGNVIFIVLIIGGFIWRLNHEQTNLSATFTPMRTIDAVS